MSSEKNQYDLPSSQPATIRGTVATKTPKGAPPSISEVAAKRAATNAPFKPQVAAPEPPKKGVPVGVLAVAGGVLALVAIVGVLLTVRGAKKPELKTESVDVPAVPAEGMDSPGEIEEPIRANTAEEWVATSRISAVVGSSLMVNGIAYRINQPIPPFDLVYVGKRDGALVFRDNQGREYLRNHGSGATAVVRPK